MAVNVDWLPTILDLCSLDPVDHPIDGKSIKETLHNNEVDTSHKTFYWTTGDQKRWAVRQGPWKLLKNPIDPTDKYPIDPERDSLFLVNLENDISEKNNLTTQNPDIVKSLSDLYYQWFEDTQKGEGRQNLQ